MLLFFFTFFVCSVKRLSFVWTVIGFKLEFEVIRKQKLHFHI